MPYKDLRTDFAALLATEPSNDSLFTRRRALKAALGMGYALSAMPLMAQTAIHTPAKGLVSGPITYAVDGFQVPAYRSAPQGQTNLPVVLVVQEIFGVHEYIADVTRRLAQAGYLAIAPSLYARQGDSSRYTDTSLLISELVAKVPDTQVLADLDGAVKWAATQGGDVNRLGVTGFCWGGRITWLYAAHAPVKAAVAWYGRLIGEKNPTTPQQAVDIAPALKAPVLGLYGGADTGISMDSIDTMKLALGNAAQQGNRAAQNSKFLIYPDTPHAFHADYRASYRPGPAADGWRQMLEWFQQYGVR